MLPARLATAAVAIPLLLVVIFWVPPWGFAALVSILAILALAEFVGFAFPEHARDRVVALCLGTLVVVVATGGPSRSFVAALTAVVVVGLVWAVFSGKERPRGLNDLGLMLVGILYIGLLMPHFIWLHQLADGARWVTFVVAVGMLGDAAGYFVGRAVGRHPLLPRISPGKTLEGAAGILVTSVIVGALVKIVLLRTRGWVELLSLALVMGILGQLGDLSESAMKRSFGTKESGWVFPGHGGVLDRVDSLLFPVAFVYYYVTLL